MKRLLPFVALFVVIVSAGVVAKVAMGTGVQRCTAYVDQGFNDLVIDVPCVRLHGSARYEVVVRQVTPGNLLRDEQVHYLFPFFPEGDHTDRAVRVMVRTTRAPEERVDVEVMTLEGRLRRVTPEIVPYSAEISFGKRSGYFFRDDMLLLEPDRLVP